MQTQVEIVNPGVSRLRKFGIIMAVMIPLLFGITFPWIFETRFPYWPWILACLFTGWSLLSPVTLAPVYHWWMKFGMLMNAITTPVILAILFYCMIFPVGFLKRRFGSDPIDKGMDRNKTSYRIPSKKNSSESLEKQF